MTEESYNKNNKLALILAEDLALVEDNSLNEKQLKQILQRTPTKYVKQRPAKGGGTWDYVTGGYVKKCLNIMFGWDWDFEILDEKILYGEAIVKGKLTCRSSGKSIIKMQFGNKDIVFKKDVDKDGNRVPLSIGNDLKSAATDCLKKCAAELGIAADIYNKDDFNEVKVTMEREAFSFERLKFLYDEKINLIKIEDIEHVERVLHNKEEKSYRKFILQLEKL